MLTLETLPAWLAALYSLGHAYPWVRLLLASVPQTDDAPRRDPILTAVLTVVLSAGSLALIMLALALGQTPPSFRADPGPAPDLRRGGVGPVARTSPSPRVERGQRSPDGDAGVRSTPRSWRRLAYAWS